jgi:hypothetical protein
MSTRPAIAILVLTLALAGLALPPVSRPSPSPQGQAPSEAEIHALAEQLLANQHKNDELLDQYERVERHVDRTGGADSRTLEDKTYRVVPTGGGTMKILLKDGAQAVDPAAYRRQLQTWEDVLEMMLKPGDPRAKSASDKYAKRMHDRAEFVTAIRDAYIVKWVGRETRNGRACDVYELNPNPDFHPRSMFQTALADVTVKIWVDRDTNQLVRGEAQVIRDISFGAGILGKLYRGGTVSMDQAEVSPGVWLPTHYQYDFSGRKFLFSFSQHQFIEANRYRRIGLPQEALAVAQSDLASGKTFSVDP